jgi:hypothetical protein
LGDDAGFAVGGVEDTPTVPGVAQVAERGDFGVQIHANLDHFRLGDACVSANVQGRFRVNEFLVERLGGQSDSIDELRVLKLREELKQGGLVWSHPARRLSVRNFDQFSLTIARWLLTLAKQRSRAGNPSTPREMTPRL